MKARILPLLLLALQVFAGSAAHAEKGDSDKPIDIVSDLSEDNDIKQIRTFTGNVVLTEGTLVMKGTKLVVETRPDGWTFATLYAPSNGLATMRQKRDGGPDLWMEGEAAERITYDQKTSVATLYTRSKVRRLTGVAKTDEATGPFLSYNSQTEIVTGAMSPTGESKDGGIERPHVWIQPQHKTPAAGAAGAGSTPANTPAPAKDK